MNGELKATLLDSANTYTNIYRSSQYASKKHEILEILHKNNNIIVNWLYYFFCVIPAITIVMRPYRSGDTVIMDRDVYTH